MAGPGEGSHYEMLAHQSFSLAFCNSPGGEADAAVSQEWHSGWRFQEDK